MDHITVLRAFTRLVECGSFTAVADEMRVKQSTVSKWLQSLEARLDQRLLDRTTRAVHVTEAGHRFHARALRVLQAFDDAFEAAPEAEGSLRGSLRVSVPEVFGRRHVVPVAAKFVQQHPALSLDLVFADRYVRLVEEGFDLAIRLGRSGDSTLRAHRLGSTPRRLVASPGYLRRCGVPKKPADLARHECLSHSGALGHSWSFTRNGTPQRVRVRGRISTNNSEATLLLARRGLGIGLLASWLTDAEIRAGRLTPLLEDYTAGQAKITALTPPGRHMPPRLRAFVGALRDGLADL